VLLLTEGAGTVESVDRALLKFGIALGAFQMADLAGNDVGYNIRKERGWVRHEGNPSPSNRPVRYTELGDDLVTKLSRLGQKAGKGWYDYDPKVGKGRKSLPSKEVTDFVSRYVTNPSPRLFSEAEVLERVMFALVNEGFKCLEEGIAQRPSDIDVVYLYGYGWPAWRGGPMWWADTEVGLKRMLDKLREFTRSFPGTDYYVPSSLLEDCVRRNLTVDEYYKKGLDKSPTSRL